MKNKLKVWGSESKEYNDLLVFGRDASIIKAEFDMFIESLVEEGETCIDSFRIAEALDPEAMKIYAKLHSCCGSKDIAKEVNGILYMFGANFGH